MKNDVFRIALASFEPTLRSATDNLEAIVAVANELGAERVEPSHILLTLSRIPGGTAASFLGEHRVPVDALDQALHQFGGDQAGEPIHSIDETTASEATLEAFEALRQQAAQGERITESHLLGHALLRLEQPVAEMLDRFARIDVGRWATRLLEGQPAPSLFLASEGTLDLTLFSPRTRLVLETMARETGALGLHRQSTILLLHTLAVTPNGLVETGLRFQQHDVRTVRARLLTLVSDRTRPATAEVPLRRTTMEPALVLAFERAAAAARSGGRASIGERDLLAAMLKAPGGIVANFLRDTAIDVATLLRFAADYYQEQAAPEAERRKLSPQEAVNELRNSILGQNHVLERLIPYLEVITLRLELGYRRDDRPAAALFFCGPSGTGKTMTAKVLARILFGSEDDILMFEMGQFNTRESINNFIGAPPGYIGFGEGKLTNGLRDNARRVILFDEVEKADERVFDALLRLLDDGRIDDPAGPVRDARESVIVLTSNLGAKELGRRNEAQAPLGSHLDHSDDHARRERAAYRQMLERFFRPEFLNRVDEVIVFEEFGDAELRAIAVSALQREAAKVRRELAVDLTWSDEVPRHLAARAATWRPEEAARGVNRCVAELVLAVLRLLHEARARGETVTRVQATVSGDDLQVTPS